MSELDAYLDLVAEQGCAEADATSFEAAWDHLEAAYFERLAIAMEGRDDWRDKLRAAASETVRLTEAYPQQARFLAVDSLAAGEPGQRRQQAFRSRLAELLDTARDQLDDPDAVPDAAAPWIAGVFFDRIYRRLATGDGLDLSSQLPELMFLAVSSYFGTEAGLEELLSPP